MPVVALFLFALAVRALPWARILGGDHVVFHGTDAYYHARRILWSAEHLPASLRFDPFINHPHGGEPIWPPLFDGAAAVLVRLLAPADDPEAAYRLLVWLPPLLGAATVVLVWWIARRHLGAAAAWIAAVVLALLPAHFRFTQLGYLDHHAAVSLLATATLGLGMELARRGTGAQPLIARAVTLGAVLGASLLVWPGCVLYLLLVVFSLGVTMVVTESSRASAGLAAALAVASGVALLLVAPFGLDREWIRWGSFSPLVLSGFQPWFLACATAGFSLLALRLRASPAIAPGRRAGEALVLALLVVALSAWLVPGISSGFEDAWSWFAREESFQSQVEESHPLLFYRGHFELTPAVNHLGLLIYVLPLLAGHAVWLALREGPHAARRVLLGWFAALLLATLFQKRFLETFSPVLALVLAWSLSSIHRDLARRWGGSTVAVGLVSGMALALAPALAAAYLPEVQRDLAAVRGDELPYPAVEERRRSLMEVARWLGQHSEDGGDFDAAAGTPSYGVMSHWADGHVIQHAGRRATVVNNFGDDLGAENFELARRYYLLSEAEASVLLDGLGVRYALFEFRRIPGRKDFEPDSVLARLYFQDGAATVHGYVARGGKLSESRVVLPALERHRLVYESPPAPGADASRPRFKLYEHVRGALVEGRAEPGAEVRLRLVLTTSQGRRFTYTAKTHADAEGRYTQRLPHATRGAAPGVRANGPYEIRSGLLDGVLSLDERDVVEGRTVRAPDLVGPSDG